MLDIKKLLTKIIKEDVRLKEVTSSSVTISGSSRNQTDVAVTGIPASATIIGCVVTNTPNSNWIFANCAMSATRTLRIYYSNEYTGNLSGTFTALVFYRL